MFHDLSGGGAQGRANPKLAFPTRYLQSERAVQTNGGKDDPDQSERRNQNKHETFGRSGPGSSIAQPDEVISSEVRVRSGERSANRGLVQGSTATVQHEGDVFERGCCLRQHLRQRPRNHANDLSIIRIGDRFHISDNANYGVPGSVAIEPSPTNSFSNGRLVRPKSLGNALADNADQRRVGSVAFSKITALKEGLPNALEITRHSDSRIRRVKTARLGRGRAFGVEQHESPGCIHWRGRHDGRRLNAWK